ncbi:MAG TPA: glycosyltransferase [Terriglobia bacterium]|nr:glycosyltransferase [Terriglobia bacterium]
MQSIGTSERLPEPRIAHIVSRFPVLTETFVLYELAAMERLGVVVELYPLLRARPKVTHPEAWAWIKRAHYHPFLSFSILRAQWHFIRRDPVAYFKVWAEVLRGTWGSANFFLGAIAIFPKTVEFAYDMTRKRIAHIHAHFANHPAVAALIVHRLTGIPFSFTAHGTDLHVDRHMLKEKVEAAALVITVTSYNKQIIIDECGPGVGAKIHVIHGGVDVGRLSPTAKGQSRGPFRILCIARFEEVKGHTYLVEACRLLRERGVSFECRLIGDGPLLPAIVEQVTHARLSNQVLLAGARPYQEVIEELAQADVLVLPTAPTASGKREGSPTVLKEAMACGLPVVASRVGGIPELVDDDVTGMLLPPRNAAALADALQRLSGDPALRQRLGRAARQKVVREFNLRTSTAKRAELFLRSARAVQIERTSVSGLPSANSQVVVLP